MPFPAVFELSDLNGQNGTRFFGGQAGAFAGWSVASLGDVNGDGLEDFIIGAPGVGTIPGNGSSGYAYVIFGRTTPWGASLSLEALSAADGFRLEGIDPADEFGGMVAGGGDFNGDGLNDIIIGSVYAQNSPAAQDNSQGQVYVVFGRTSGWPSSFDVANLNGTNGFRLDGVDGSDEAGSSAAFIGDFNADGFDDLVVGVRYGEPTGVALARNEGEVFVIFGRAGAWPAFSDLDFVNGVNGFRVTGTAASDQIGNSVAGAGDINGDGVDDLVIGASFAESDTATSQQGRGEVYVLFGRSGVWQATFDASAISGDAGFRIDGIDGLDNAGASVASAGDFNGDGIDDLLIGAPFGESSTATAALNRGQAYVVFGRTGDWPDALSLSSLNGANGVTFEGIGGADEAGFSVSGAGDINGDGISDIIIGARYAAADGAGSTQNNAGETYVVFGRSTPFPAVIDLASLDGTQGFQLEGIGPTDESGSAVSFAGDVNDDGFDDLIVGARFHGASTLPAPGSAFLIYGRAQGPIVRSGSADADRLRAGEFEDRLNGLGGNDVLVGRGGADTLDGGTGVDTSVYGVSSSASSFSRAVSGVWTVNAGADGVDTLTGVEYLQFANRTLALRPAEGSIDGNGTSDIVLRNTNGTIALWTQTGPTTMSAQIVAASDPSFAALGQGDFNGDGRFDLLFRNAGGILAQWQMNGATVSAVGAYVTDPNWTVAGIGDFNGDFRDDILWRNSSGPLALWQMNGLNASAVGVFAASDPTWAVSQIADFNGDGRDDILWRNSSGLLALWQMNGFAVTSAGVIATSDPTWAIVGTGDFNGDLREDILWRSSTGVLAQWTMDGPSVTGVGTFAVSDTAWSVSDIGDYNGDGRDDILWEGPDRTFALWTLNGLAVTSAGLIGNPGAGWNDLA